MSVINLFSKCLFNEVYTPLNSFLLVIIFSSIVTTLLLSLFYILAYFNFEYIPLNQVSFECGFDPSADVTLRPAFVVRHMVVAIFFLVFDLELLLLAPGVLSDAPLAELCDHVIVCLVITFMFEVEFNVFHLN